MVATDHATDEEKATTTTSGSSAKTSSPSAEQRQRYQASKSTSFGGGGGDEVPLVDGDNNANDDATTNKKERWSTACTALVNNPGVIKYVSLVMLVFQMVFVTILMRYTRAHRKPEQAQYLASTAVFLTEFMKLCISCVAQSCQGSGNLLTELRYHLFETPKEVLKMSVPSFLYTIQNNLMYLSLSNLDATTYQVLNQLKILTTALFSVFLLGRRFSCTKWIGLAILAAGAAMVHTSGSSDSSSNSQANDKESQNRLVGLTAILASSCTSGFAGVYFEKILKSKQANTGQQTSLWLRNIQMYVSSLSIAFFLVFAKDGAHVMSKGFLVGYSPLVWTVVVAQAVGGLLVSIVVKYADNVIKIFATSFSIIILCVISAMFLDFAPNNLFFGGTCLVILATAMYMSPEKKKQQQSQQQQSQQQQQQAAQAQRKAGGDGST